MVGYARFEITARHRDLVKVGREGGEIMRWRSHRIEGRASKLLRHSDFCHSFVIRHSSFVIWDGGKAKTNRLPASPLAPASPAPQTSALRRK